MKGLELRGIEKRFGAVTAVTDVSLHVPEGELVSFLGPSGCGKTTLLRLIAGLETPDAGAVLLDGEEITGLPTHRRNIGMVFQSLALFPHLSAGENITYALRVGGMDAAGRRRRAAELLELVRLPGVENRHISQLSGGQRQRVAIARALAMRPKLFLLDEPLSALDAKLREDMQLELRLLQQRLGVTTVVVTHDQREAMTMSDRIVVMGDHRVQQVGAPLEIYRNPANTFVAEFIGTSNFLPGVVCGARRVAAMDTEFDLEAMPEGLAKGAAVTLSIRPEDVHVHAKGANGPNRVHGTVTFVRDLGVSVETYVDVAGRSLVGVATPKDRSALRQGDAATVELPADAVIVLRS